MKTVTEYFGFGPHVIFPMIISFCGFLPVMLGSAMLTDLTVGFFNNGFECHGSAADQSDECKRATAKASLANAIALGLNSLLTFMGAPIMGALADNFGRRPMLIIATLAYNIPLIFLALYQKFGVSLYFYFFLKAASGLFDVFTALMAYTADVTEPVYRSRSFALILGSLSVCMVGGPLAGTAIGEQQVFMVGAMLGVGVSLFVLLMVPESLRPESRVPYTSHVLNPFVPMKILLRAKMFRRLALVVFFSFIPIEGILTCLAPWQKDVLGSTEEQIALVSVAFGISAAVASAVILPILVRLRLTPRAIVIIGLSFLIVASVGFAFVTHYWGVFVMISLQALGLVVFPSISAMKANNASEKQQGVIQGALSGCRALGGVLGTLVYSGLLSAFTSKTGSVPYYPGAPFLFGAVCAVLSIIFACKTPRSLNDEEYILMFGCPRKVVIQDGEPVDSKAVAINDDDRDAIIISSSNDITEPLVSRQSTDCSLTMDDEVAAPDSHCPVIHSGSFRQSDSVLSSQQ